jgi:hypothetical protein
MVESPRMPETYQVFHSVGEKNPSNWFRLPIDFTTAVTVIETNGYQSSKNLTAEEIAINNTEAWTIVFFDSEHKFQRVYSLLSQ